MQFKKIIIEKNTDYNFCVFYNLQGNEIAKKWKLDQCENYRIHCTIFLIYFGCLFFYSSPSLSGIKYLQTFIAHTTGNLHLASKNTEQTWKLTFNSKAGWHTQIKDVKASKKCGYLTKQEMLPFSPTTYTGNRQGEINSELWSVLICKRDMVESTNLKCIPEPDATGNHKDATGLPWEHLTWFKYWGHVYIDDIYVYIYIWMKYMNKYIAKWRNFTRALGKKKLKHMEAERWKMLHGYWMVEKYTIKLVNKFHVYFCQQRFKSFSFPFLQIQNVAKKYKITL